jgi:hypothetical protein
MGFNVALGAVVGLSLTLALALIAGRFVAPGSLLLQVVVWVDIPFLVWAGAVTRHMHRQRGDR